MKKADTSIIDLLVNNFRKDKSLTEVQQDYEALEQEIERERAAHGENSRRLKALNIVADCQLQFMLKMIAIHKSGWARPRE